MVGYTYIDLIFGIAVAVIAGLIILLIRYMVGKFYEWLKKIRELSDEVMKNRKVIEQLKKEMMKNSKRVKELDKELREREQS
jgi:cell division protein FtsL